MTVVTEDLVDGHRLRDILGGSTISRTFRVADLVAAAPGQLIEAIRDPLIPKVGNTYPNEPTLFVLSVDAAPDGPNAARVVCNYAVANRPSGGTWNQPFPTGNDGRDVKQISSGIREVQTFRDAGGSTMLLVPPASKAQSPSYLSSATTFVPVGSIVFERTETSPAADRMRTLTSKLNASVLGNYPEKTLLFRSFEEQSEDGGQTWNCTYVFDYADSWAHVDIWRDEDGKIPADGVPVAYDILPTANFSVLGLDFSDSQTPL